MHKFLWLFILLILLSGSAPAVSAKPAAGSGEKVLRVYTWPEYVPEWVYDLFSAETGVTVNVEYYVYYAEMMKRLQDQRRPGFDVLVLSSVSLARLRKQNMLLELDKKQLPNLAYLFPELMDKSFDPGNRHSIPYFWGLTGIVLNTALIPESLVTKWLDLWDPKFKGKIFLQDDPRVILSMGLKALGYSCNDPDEAHQRQAIKKIEELIPSVAVVDGMDIWSYLNKRQVELGIFFNDLAPASLQNAQQIKFIFPQDGAIMWIDNLGIAHNAVERDLAHSFLNFVMRPDVALRLAMDIGSATPNQEAFASLPAEVRNDPIHYPAWDEVADYEIEDDLGAAALEFGEHWLKLLSDSGL